MKYKNIGGLKNIISDGIDRMSTFIRKFSGILLAPLGASLSGNLSRQSKSQTPLYIWGQLTTGHKYLLYQASQK
jgi:hypothetical protein